MWQRLATALTLSSLTACCPTLGATSEHALARLGAPGVVTTADPDSAVVPAPDVTQCADGREVRRYGWGGGTAVVVALRGRWVVSASVERNS